MDFLEATIDDIGQVLDIERVAFGGDESLIELVSNLLADGSAQPLLSLLAFEEGQAVGHVLFSHATVGETKAALLAPLAVVPRAQGRGIGGGLIHAGLSRLTGTGCDLVFVLGYPDYYNRHGFVTAVRLGLNAPFPIPPENEDAWMVQALNPDVIGTVTGTLKCADAIHRQEYWRE